ncbi:gluconate 2-dehydrogenase subunit 3 family protein, partial [Sphingobacterium siyangense]
VENKDYFFFKQKMDKLRDNTANHFFFLLKQLTLTGFFTSEIGMTKALRFVKVPGRFDGEFPYEKGEHAWAV